MAPKKLAAMLRKVLEPIAHDTRRQGYGTASVHMMNSLKKLEEAGYIVIGAAVDGTEDVYVKAEQPGLDEIPFVAPQETAQPETAPSEAVEPEADNGISGSIATDGNDNETSDSENSTVSEVQNSEAVKTRKPPVMVKAEHISTGMGLPPAKGARAGGSGRKSLYPFGSLAAPQRAPDGTITGMSYFFVAATEERPEPAKALQSTVTGYNKKAGEGGVDPVTGNVPKFQVFVDSENGIDGAKVFRVQ